MITLNTLRQAGVPAVETTFGHNLLYALGRNKTVWIRADAGNAGKFHLKTSSYKEGREWIASHKNMIVSPYLEGINIGVDLVFDRKNRVSAYMMKERISYSLKELDNESGGQARIAKVRLLPYYRKWAEKAVKAIDKTPQGVFSVDFKDKYVTEINAGRFLTSSLALFHLTGYNLAKHYVEIGLKQKKTELPEYPEGAIVVRQVDSEPKLIRR